MTLASGKQLLFLMLMASSKAMGGETSLGLEAGLRYRQQVESAKPFSERSSELGLRAGLNDFFVADYIVEASGDFTNYRNLDNSGQEYALLTRLGASTKGPRSKQVWDLNIFENRFLDAKSKQGLSRFAQADRRGADLQSRYEYQFSSRSLLSLQFAIGDDRQSVNSQRLAARIKLGREIAERLQAGFSLTLSRSSVDEKSQNYAAGLGFISYEINALTSIEGELGVEVSDRQGRRTRLQNGVLLRYFSETTYLDFKAALAADPFLDIDRYVYQQLYSGDLGIQMWNDNWLSVYATVVPYQNESQKVFRDITRNSLNIGWEQRHPSLRQAPFFRLGFDCYDFLQGDFHGHEFRIHASLTKKF